MMGTLLLILVGKMLFMAQNLEIMGFGRNTIGASSKSSNRPQMKTDSNNLTPQASILPLHPTFDFLGHSDVVSTDLKKAHIKNRTG